MGDHEDAKLYRQEAMWLLGMTSHAVRLQDSRVEAALSSRTYEDPIEDDLTIDILQLITATHRFGLALERTSASKAPGLFEEFSAAVGDMSALRHLIEHADEWMAGAGGRLQKGGVRLGKMQGFEIMVAKSGGRVLAIQPMGNEHIEVTRPVVPLEFLPAVERALAVLHGRRRVGDPN